MNMNFYFQSTATNILFEGFTVIKTWEFALTCLLFAVGAIILELVATISSHLAHRYTTNPLEMNWTSSINDRSPLTAPLQIPSSVKKVKKRRFKIHLGRTISHMISVTLGYMMMLVVMTYNAYFLIAVALGSAAGYFLFAPFRKRPKKRAPIDRRAQRDTLTRSGQMDVPDGESGEHSVRNVNYYGTL